MIFKEINRSNQDHGNQTKTTNSFLWEKVTEFVQLQPLKTKVAEEVAYTLLDIFTILGVPSLSLIHI